MNDELRVGQIVPFDTKPKEVVVDAIGERQCHCGGRLLLVENPETKERRFFHKKPLCRPFETKNPPEFMAWLEEGDRRATRNNKLAEPEKPATPNRRQRRAKQRQQRRTRGKANA